MRRRPGRTPLSSFIARAPLLACGRRSAPTRANAGTARRLHAHRLDVFLDPRNKPKTVPSAGRGPTLGTQARLPARSAAAASVSPVIPRRSHSTGYLQHSPLPDMTATLRRRWFRGIGCFPTSLRECPCVSELRAKSAGQLLKPVPLPPQARTACGWPERRIGETWLPLVERGLASAHADYPVRHGWTMTRPTRTPGQNGRSTRRQQPRSAHGRITGGCGRSTWSRPGRGP